MISACSADVHSTTCQNHLQQARLYSDWAERFGTSTREYYFDVGAQDLVLDVDWGGDLDALALDVFEQVQNNALSQEEANQRIIDRAIPLMVA